MQSNWAIVAVILIAICSPVCVLSQSKVTSCQNNWVGIGDSCYLLVNRSSGVAEHYHEARSICYKLGGTLADLRVCNGISQGCSGWQLALENRMLNLLQINDTVLIAARMHPSISRKFYYWDADTLRMSLRPWSLNARQAQISPLMIGDAFAASKENLLCLSVVKLSDSELRYRPVACDTKQQILCRLIKFSLPWYFITCYILWFGILITASGLTFRMHKANLLQ